MRDRVTGAMWKWAFKLFLMMYNGKKMHFKCWNAELEGLFNWNLEPPRWRLLWIEDHHPEFKIVKEYAAFRIPRSLREESER